MQAQESVTEAIEAIDSTSLMELIVDKFAEISPQLIFFAVIALVAIWLWRRRRK